MPDPSSPQVETLRMLAQRIVDRLFRVGHDNEAHRLVLVKADGRDMGGWGRVPARDVVADELAAFTQLLAEQGRTAEERKELLARVDGERLPERPRTAASNEPIRGA